MRKGFTLVELLIVIIIIGILATMAVPQYQKMVNRAKWAEAAQLASAIKTAENLYYAEQGDWTAATKNLTDLGSYLDLPTTNARSTRFSIKTKGAIYAVHKDSGLADDFDKPAVPTGQPFYYLNLDTNTTGYENNAPGLIKK